MGNHTHTKKKKPKKKTPTKKPPKKTLPSAQSLVTARIFSQSFEGFHWGPWSFDVTISQGTFELHQDEMALYNNYFMP